MLHRSLRCLTPCCRYQIEGAVTPHSDIGAVNADGTVPFPAGTDLVAAGENAAKLIWHHDCLEVAPLTKRTQGIWDRWALRERAAVLETQKVHVQVLTAAAAADVDDGRDGEGTDEGSETAARVERGAGGGGGEVARSVSVTVVDEPSWSEKRGLPPQPPSVKLHEIATLDSDSQIWRLD